MAPTRQKMEKQMPERRFVLWLMGPTSSGKSTLAERLTAILRADDVPIIHFDGDEVRDFFGPDHGFDEADRRLVVGTLIHLANKSRKAGLNVVVSALTAHAETRDAVLTEIPDVVTGYVRCSIKVCAERDPKGLYRRAQNGEIHSLIGVNSEYVAPENPNVVLDTETETPEALVEAITGCLREKGYRW